MAAGEFHRDRAGDGKGQETCSAAGRESTGRACCARPARAWGSAKSLRAIGIAMGRPWRRRRCHRGNRKNRQSRKKPHLWGELALSVVAFVVDYPELPG